MPDKDQKAQDKKLREKLFRRPAVAWDAMDEKERKAAMEFAEGYKAFLDGGKTEREAVARAVERAKATGFAPGAGKGKGGRYYWEHRGKNAAFAVSGTKGLADGLRIVVAHVDAPRLDLKQNPLYEDVGLGLLKTHYYGGIKKYQWLSRPLAIHGRIVRADGTALDLAIGEDPRDPVFAINDLLPHLSAKAQNDKKIAEAVPGEKLNVLIGSLPRGDKETRERVKLALLALLNEKYGIVEEDFVSAELEVVPAEKARDVGIDRSMIGAYGQDDRVCSYAALRAVLAAKKPKATSLCVLLDKEEIGSEGNTGAQSRFLFDVVGDLLAREGKDSERAIRRALADSLCLSADGNAALDPDWPQVHEEKNAARLGHGVSLTKFTGVRGKAGASDAHAEFVGRVRALFNEAGVVWQAAELGKVDEGGGGTVAKFFAVHGMDVLDVGTPILAMHSPFEVTAKADVYMTYKAYLAFLERT